MMFLLYLQMSYLEETEMLEALEQVPDLHFDGNGNVAPENQTDDLASILNKMKDRLGSAPGPVVDPGTGQSAVLTAAAVQQAQKGELVLYDPTANAVAIQAPANPAPGDSFSIKNVSTHATNGAVVTPHSGGQIEDPGAPGALLAVDTGTAAIVAAGATQRWQYLVTASLSGWFNV